MKKVIRLLAVIVLGISLAGCNSSTNESETEFTFSWWGGQERNVATLAVIEMFEKANPGYKVHPQYTSWNGYYTQISNQLIAGDEPDLMQINYNWFYLFNGVSKFKDLKTMDIDLNKWPEHELDPITIDGKVLGLSVSETGRVFYLNKQVYDEAGAKIPTTWDELIEAGKKINGKDNRKFALGKLGSQATSYLMFVYLSQKYNKNVIENDKLAFSEKELLEGFRFLDELRQNGVLIPTTKSDDNNDETNPNWVDGYYGGILEWNTSVAVYANVLPNKDNLIHAGLFQINKGEEKGMYKKTSMAYAVSIKTNKTKAIEKFLKFISTNDEAVKKLGVERGVPSNKDAYEILNKADALKSREYDGHLEVQKLFSANKDCNLYIHPYYEDDTFRKVYELQFEAWLAADKTSEATAKNIIKNFDTALKNAMK